MSSQGTYIISIFYKVLTKMAPFIRYEYLLKLSLFQYMVNKKLATFFKVLTLLAYFLMHIINYTFYKVLSKLTLLSRYNQNRTRDFVNCLEREHACNFPHQGEDSKTTYFAMCIRENTVLEMPGLIIFSTLFAKELFVSSLIVQYMVLAADIGHEKKFPVHTRVQTKSNVCVFKQK